MPIGFPYPAIDPLRFLVDDEIRPFDIDQRFDLTGTGAQACPVVSSGIFIVHQHVVPDNTAEVIQNVHPHCWRRTDVGTPDESVALLDPAQIQGFVLFDRSKDNNQPYLVEHNYNSPTTAANPNNTDRQTVRGDTWISNDEPLVRDAGMFNPLSGIYLPPKSIFRVLFRLAPLASANGIPNPYYIPNQPPPATGKRIDFAGAKVSGVRMPVQTYDKLRVARRKGQLGPEASAASAEAIERAVSR